MNDTGWTFFGNETIFNNDTRLYGEFQTIGRTFVLSNETFSPFRNWTMNDYKMPDMPGWIPMSYLILLCVAIGVGIPGNLMTALAYFFIKVKSNCDWYIFFVAAFDLISCTFRVTGYLLEFLGVWAEVTNDAYCLFVSWVSQTSVGMSILIFGLIAIDRCIKVSFNSRLFISPTQSRNICLIFTVLAFILGFPTLFIYGNTPRGICIVTRTSSTRPWVQYYYCTIFILLFGMMASVIFCYLRIAWTVMKNRRVIQIMPDPAINNRIPTLDHNPDQYVLTQRYRRRPLSDNVDNIQLQASLHSPTTFHHHHSRNNRSSYHQQQMHSNSSSGAVVPTVSGAMAPSSSVTTLSIPQAPRLFVIPGPETRAIILPQTSTSRVPVSNKAGNVTNSINPVDVMDTERSLEAVTEANKKSSDDSVMNKIRFSKEQWNKRLARDYKVTGLLFLVTTMFIMSWIAPCYATFRAFFVTIKFPFTVEEAVVFIYAPNLYIINNFINPIIYLALSSSYRRKVKQFFRMCVGFFSRFSETQ